MTTIEDKTGTNGRHKKIPGISEDYIQGPVAYSPRGTALGDRDTCRACGQHQWWRKNEAGSKWICGRCHPPPPGLEVVWMDRE